MGLLSKLPSSQAGRERKNCRYLINLIIPFFESGMFQFYRESNIGKAFQDTIEEKINSQLITPQQGNDLLEKFDNAVYAVFNRSVHSKMSFKASIITYKHFADVWTFVVKNFVMTINDELVRADKVKIVACDANITAERGGYRQGGKGTEKKRSLM
jgi:transcription initiation factor TFIIA small subunit